MAWTLTDIILWGVRGLLVLLFVALGRRDLTMLVRRPARLGMGLGRSWAVARATMLEAWAGRIWMLPLLWFVGSLIVISVVRPFEESERIPLYIRVLLTGQELLLLVMMAVMACVSLPRERERKILVTNASKPLSRLEIVLGKMIGFSVMAGVMLVVMGAMSWAILKVSDLRAQTRAGEENRLAEDDLARRIRGQPGAPEQQRTRLSEEGSLFAYNYISVPPGGMSVVGSIDFQTKPPVRWLKGASNERVIYRFRRLEAPEVGLEKVPGSEPYMLFQFPALIVSEKPPASIQIQVSAVRSAPYLPSDELVAQTRTLKLDSHGMAFWQPDEPRRIFSLFEPGGVSPENDLGEVTVEVSCLTPGVMLQIFEGAEPNPETNKIPADALFNIMVTGNRSDPTKLAQVPHANPIVRGFERRDRQEISGPKEADLGAKSEEGGVIVETGVFRFAGEHLTGIPIDGKGNFRLALNLHLDNTGNYGEPTKIRVIVRSMDSRKDPFVLKELIVAEKRLTTIDVPATYLGNPDESKRGDMYVMVNCITKEHAISVLEDSVRIELPQTRFAWNLWKSEAVIFFEVSLLIAICVTCSIRLGWPVAMLLAGTCWMFGYLVTFIGGLQEMGGLAALGYIKYTDRSATFEFFNTTANGVWMLLGVVASVVPNFLPFQPLEYLPELRNMPVSVLGMDLLWTIAYALPVVAIAYLLARKQELG